MKSFYLYDALIEEMLRDHFEWAHWKFRDYAN